MAIFKFIWHKTFGVEHSLKLTDAIKLSHELLDMDYGHLDKHFENFRVCGSIRRNKEEVNDIDIVAIQKENYSFGEETLDQTIQRLDPSGLAEAKQLGRHGIARYALGDKLKRFKYKDIRVEIYLAKNETFETLVLIKTGSEEHNKQLVTLARGKGLKLFADGTGLCKIHYEKGKEVIDKIVANTEDSILEFLLNRIPKPEERY